MRGAGRRCLLAVAAVSAAIVGADLGHARSCVGRPVEDCETQARRLQGLAVPLRGAAAAGATSRSSTWSRRAGADTRRAAAPSTGRTPPTATGEPALHPQGLRPGAAGTDHRLLSRQPGDAGARCAAAPAGAAASGAIRAQRGAGGAAVRGRCPQFQRRAVLGAGRAFAATCWRRPSTWHASTAHGARPAFDALGVVIVAYSGGYYPAARGFRDGGVGGRLRGIVMLDALYGEMDVYARWIEGRGRAFFFSAYARSAREENAGFQKLLGERGIDFATAMPASWRPGSVTSRCRRGGPARRLRHQGLGGGSAGGRVEAHSRVFAHAAACAGAAAVISTVIRDGRDAIGLSARRWWLGETMWEEPRGGLRPIYLCSADPNGVGNKSPTVVSSTPSMKMGVSGRQEFNHDLSASSARHKRVLGKPGSSPQLTANASNLEGLPRT